MNKKLKNAFENEISIGKKFYQNREYQKSFHHFERAHILGQLYIIPHTKSHLWMLKVGIKTADIREIIGQLIRIPAGIVASAVGLVPIGNTGGSNVSATKKMEIPPDLFKIMEQKNDSL